MNYSIEAELQNAYINELKGDFYSAETIYRKIIEFSPNHVECLNKLALVLAQQKKILLAKDYLEKVVLLDPSHSGTLCNLGNCYTELNDLNSARVFFEKAIQVDSCCIDAYYNLGNTFCKLNEPVAAIECYRQAINLSPDLPYIYYNLANTLTVLERFDEAIKYYEHIQPLYIGNADYCINLAQCFFHKRNYKLSIDWVLKSLKIRENNPEAFNYLGRIYALIGEDFKAAEFYLKAHEADKDNEAYIYNLAISFVQLDCYDQGYKYAMALKTVANRLMIQHYVMSILAKWNQWEDTTKQLQKNKLQEGVTGWDFLRISDSADEQYQLMTHYSSKNFPTNNSLGPFLDKTKNKKIKIAYFSPDFRRHAVMHLAGEIFKMHDRSEFEIHGFSMHPGHTDADRESLKNYFDFLYEINQLSDKDVVLKCREIGIDIAVDLTGNTRGLRTGIFALRAAPIQVNFLGYTGTMGTDYHDYIIADPVVIPPTHSAFYSEKIVYLKSFMPRRVQLLPCQKIINRISQLLPTEGFVFCCFNKTFKFNPVTFNSWLRILKAVPLSVLWFNGVSKSSAKNLIQYATDAGVDSSRLIFSDPVIDMPSHLARHRLANLFLDTYPYNAHTTASDALWSGLPVLTRVGNSFASRVSASLLQALGLPELVVQTTESYEELAIKLATDEEKLAELRKKLRNNIKSQRLFDMQAYMLEFESALKLMYQQHEKKLSPVAIDVTNISKS